MTIAKVSRQAYRLLRQAELTAYAANVVRSTQDNPEYTTLQDISGVLDALLQQYAVALAAARNGGRAETIRKNTLKVQVINQLNIIAAAVDQLAAGDPNVIVGAGFQMALPALRLSGELLPPTVIRLNSTGRTGEIRAFLNDDLPKAVATHSVEFSIDQGGNWQNGTYNSRRNFVIANLPNGRDILLRFRAIGFANRKSDWSEPVKVAVA